VATVDSSDAAAKRTQLFGMIDAGLSSFATFLVGLFAARTLSPPELGAYALCFSAVFLVGIIPSQGYFFPAENLLVSLPQEDRLLGLRSTVSSGLWIALLSGLAVVGWLPFAPAAPFRSALLPLTVTAIAAAFLSPVQDHVRRMLHLGGVSRKAVIVSGVQIAAVLTALIVCVEVRVPKWWAPLGALAFANGASALTGVWIGGALVPPKHILATLQWRDIRRSGVWLAFLGLLDAVMAFTAAALVAHLATPAALGYAETCRLVAQPVTVASWGLLAVLGPQSVRAGQNLQPDQARKISRRFAVAVGLVGVPSLLIFGPAWHGNPMTWLLPNAYVVKGLVILSIVASLANAVLYPFRSELIGGRQESAIAVMEIKANVVRALVACSAAILHAYALPLSLLAAAAARRRGYQRMIADMYAAGSAASRTDSSPTGPLGVRASATGEPL
jgi:O-antigen/teichoic acid export membrane protein